MSNVFQSPPRATHIGSLLRPRALFEKRSQLEEGKCSATDLKDVEDTAMSDVLELQRSLGVSEITDGEVKKLVVNPPVMNAYEFFIFCRSSFFDGVFEKLEGMIYMPARMYLSDLPRSDKYSSFRRSHHWVQGKFDLQSTLHRVNLEIIFASATCHISQCCMQRELRLTRPSIVMYAYEPRLIKLISEPPPQGKIKRTRPFYVDEFKALRSIVLPEVGRYSSALHRNSWSSIS